MNSSIQDETLGTVEHVVNEAVGEDFWHGKLTIPEFTAPVPFEFYGADIEEPGQALALIKDFAANSARYLEDGAAGLHKFFQTHGEVFGLSDDTHEAVSQMTVSELRDSLREPLLKVVSSEDGELLLNLGFQECFLEGEGGVGLLFKDGKFFEVTDASGEIGLFEQ
jgi:hypothetical protein